MINYLAAFVLSFVAVTTSHASTVSEADAASILSRAESSYDRGIAQLPAEPLAAKAAFAEAAAAYRELAEARGIRNARLLASLGNAYLLAGDTGRAVLSYRRAERLDPADATVRAGMELVRSRVGTPVNAGFSFQSSGWLSAVHRVITPASLLRIGIAAWVLGWLALALATVRPGVGRTRQGGLAAVVVGAACIGFVIADIAGQRASPESVLVEDGVIGHNGPGGAAYGATFDKPMAAGVELIMVEQRGEWLRVRLADGRETWVVSSAVERV